MKKITNYALVAMMALGVASCSKEEAMGGEDITASGNLVFTIEAPASGITTYAQNDVPATALEKKINDIAVYLFNEETTAGDGDGTFVYKKVFSAPALANGTYTLDMGNPAELVLTDKYTAYFVANNGAGENTFVDLTGVTTSTTEAAFRDLPTIAVAPDVDKNLFLMAVKKSVAVNPTGHHILPVGEELRRRVSRFDLVNKNSSFTITKIKVEDANNIANAFATADNAVTATAVQPADITSFTGWEDYKETINSVETVTGQQITSLFYLNPTSISATTKIYLEGYTGTLGQPDEKKFIYALDPNPAVETKANYRYILMLDNEFKFTVAAAEWDSEGDPIKFAPNTSSFGLLSAPTVTGGTYSAIQNTIAVTPATAFTASFAFMASSTKGISVEVLPQSATGFTDLDATKIVPGAITTATTATYAAPYFESEFDVTIAADVVTADMSFASILRVTDIASGATYDLSLYYHNAATAAMFYPGTNLPVVKLYDIYWAPVNVGAITDDATDLNVSSTGYYFQYGRNEYKSRQASATNNMINGPLTRAQALANADKFIVGNDYWLVLDDADDATIQTLWETTSLCPTGWRMPTGDEINKLGATALTQCVAEQDKKRIKIIEIATGNSIYVPMSGGISAEPKYAGQATWLGAGFIIRSSTPKVNDKKRNTDARIVKSDGTVQTAESPFALGTPIRCVKDAN